MASSDVTTPALVARPLRLDPFRAVMLAPSRIGAHVSARAFARPYHDVAERFAAWQRAGRVTHDTHPALYLHEYTAAGLTVRGLVGALDLTRTAVDTGDAAVFPHEGVHPVQVQELADRMAEMALNPAPILLTHRATAELRSLLQGVRRTGPDHQFTDRSGQYHRVWAVREPQLLAQIAAELRETHALIADGHHRYAAYQRLRADHADLGPSTSGGLVMLVDQDDTPLYLGAIHRVLHGIALDDLPRDLTSPDGPTGPQEAVAALGPDTLVATDGRTWTTVRLDRAVSEDRTAVEILHHDVLPRLRRAPSSTTYAHSVDDALRAVAQRRGVAVLMPTPEFHEVLRTAEHGRLLPEKATSFQPKPSVGVLIRSLRDG